MRIKKEWKGDAAGHFDITDEIVDHFLKNLIPKELQWMKSFLDNTPYQTGEVDGFLKGHSADDEQKRHFMRAKSQRGKHGNCLAHAAGVDWIRTNLFKAAEIIFDIAQMRKKNKSGPSMERAMATRVEILLGFALHAIQDSYAPDHVRRNQNGVIVDIYVYADQDHKKHKHADQHWASIIGPELGKQMKLSCYSLLLICSLAAIQPDRKCLTDFLNRNWAKFERKYLSTNFDGI